MNGRNNPNTNVSSTPTFKRPLHAQPAPLPSIRLGRVPEGLEVVWRLDG